MSYGKSTESSVISCNVSWKRTIDAETLVGILAGEIPPEGWQAHLETFFNEQPAQIIMGTMKENNLSMAQLVKVFEALPKVFQGKNFKEISAHA